MNFFSSLALLAFLTLAAHAFDFPAPVDADINKHPAIAAQFAKADTVVVYDAIPAYLKYERRAKPEDDPEKALEALHPLRVNKATFFPTPVTLRPEDAKKITELCADKSSFAQAVTNNGKPMRRYDGVIFEDFCIEWRTGAETCRATVCLSAHLNGIAFYTPKGDLFCRIEDAAKAKFRRILEPARAYHAELNTVPGQDYNFKNHATLAAAASKAENAVVYEGLSRDVFSFKGNEKFDLDDRIARLKAIKLHNYWFFPDAHPLKPEDIKTFAAQFSDPVSFEPYAGAKKCGGFHPDYLVEWTLLDGKYSVMLCRGCHDVHVIAPATTLFCGIDKEVLDKFTTLLGQYNKHTGEDGRAPAPK